MKQFLVFLILLMSTITFAYNMECFCFNGEDSSFRVELRYLNTEQPEYISYVNGDLWAHWYMDKQSPMMIKSYYFKWYNGSNSIISYSYKTKILKLIHIGGEYPSITELECKEK